MKDHRDLEVWRRGHALTLQIYRVTEGFPRDELFGLTGQMRRAASSVPANIAEGCGRNGDAELRRFPTIAFGSACELDYFVFLATELGHIDPAASASLVENCLRLRRKLGAFIKKPKA